jgi:GT2 family glycosyltransferase
VGDIELSGGSTAFDPSTPPGGWWGTVRLHSRVLGTRLLTPGELTGEEQVRERLLRDLDAGVRAHRERYGCPVRPQVEGEVAACLARRARLLRAAPTVSVVIATRDRPHLLHACVESLLRQTHPPLEIVVVDNAPATDLTERLVSEQDSWSGTVAYVKESRPGLGRAHNAALPLVRGEVVAVTDDDVVADRHWLAAALEAFVEHDAGCVTGPILPLELRTQAQAWVEQYGGFARGYTRRVFSLSSPPPGDPLFPFTAGRFGSGANMAFRLDALRRIGGFDPFLGAGTRARGGDDLAAFARVVLSGERLVYTPDAVVRHRHHSDYAGLRRMAHGYGVGLGAYLTSLLAADARLVPQMARRLPAGLRHLVGATSEKNRRIQADYPRELVHVERAGVVQGPLCYALSRLDGRLDGRLGGVLRGAAGGPGRRERGTDSDTKGSHPCPTA